MRKVLGLSCLVGACVGALVGFLAAQLSHVSTFALAGLSISGPRRAVEFRPSAQPVVTWAVLGGIVAAFLTVVVSVSAGARLVHDSTCPNSRLLTAVCLAGGAALGAATVVLVHYASWTAALHTHQFGLDTVGIYHPSWLPSLPIAMGIGGIVGAAGAHVIQAVGVGLVSGKRDRSLIAARASE